MDDPLVSVVIPAYNVEEFVADAIWSVERQLYKDIEIIVVNDKSTDDTWKKVVTSLSRTTRSTWAVQLDKHSGECKASADGFERAKGKYVCRLSADDMYISRSHICHQVGAMEKYNLDWCYNSVNWTGPQITKAMPDQGYWIPLPYSLCRPWMGVFDNWILKHPMLAAMIETRRLPVNSSTLMIRKTAYDKILWDPSFKTNCDEVLIQRMLQAGMRGMALTTPGVFYRLHPGQQTNWAGHKQKVQETRARLKKEILEGDHAWWFKLYIKLIGWK